MKGNLIFKSAEQQARLAGDGYFITPLLSPSEITGLRDLFYSCFKEAELPEVFDSLNGVDAATRKKINDGVFAICNDALSRVIENYKVVVSLYFSKKSGNSSAIGRHVDPSMTLEDYNHIGFWIPLVDVNEETGKFYFLRGSQNYTPPYFALSIPHPYQKVDHLAAEYMHGVKVRAGEAIVFHNRVLHGTASNISGQTRVAVIIKVIDNNAPLVNAWLDESNAGSAVELYSLPDDYYVSNDWRKVERPSSAVHIGYLNGAPVQFEEADFENLIKRHTPDKAVNEYDTRASS